MMTDSKSVSVSLRILVIKKQLVIKFWSSVIRKQAFTWPIVDLDPCHKASMGHNELMYVTHPSHWWKE